MSATCLAGELLASVMTICQPHLAATSLKLLVSASRHGLLLSVCAKPTRRGFLFGILGSASSAALAMPATLRPATSDSAASADSGRMPVAHRREVFLSDSMSSSDRDGLLCSVLLMPRVLRTAVMFLLVLRCVD